MVEPQSFCVTALEALPGRGDDEPRYWVEFGREYAERLPLFQGFSYELFEDFLPVRARDRAASDVLWWSKHRVLPLPELRRRAEQAYVCRWSVEDLNVLHRFAQQPNHAQVAEQDDPGVYPRATFVYGNAARQLLTQSVPEADALPAEWRTFERYGGRQSERHKCTITMGADFASRFVVVLRRPLSPTDRKRKRVGWGRCVIDPEKAFRANRWASDQGWGPQILSRYSSPCCEVRPRLHMSLAQYFKLLAGLPRAHEYVGGVMAGVERWRQRLKAQGMTHGSFQVSHLYLHQAASGRVELRLTEFGDACFHAHMRTIDVTRFVASCSEVLTIAEVTHIVQHQIPRRDRASVWLTSMHDLIHIPYTKWVTEQLRDMAHISWGEFGIVEDVLIPDNGANLVSPGEKQTPLWVPRPVSDAHKGVYCAQQTLTLQTQVFSRAYELPARLKKWRVVCPEQQRAQRHVWGRHAMVCVRDPLDRTYLVHLVTGYAEARRERIWGQYMAAVNLGVAFDELRLVMEDREEDQAWKYTHAFVSRQPVVMSLHQYLDQPQTACRRTLSRVSSALESLLRKLRAVDVTHGGLDDIRRNLWVVRSSRGRGRRYSLRVASGLGLVFNAVIPRMDSLCLRSGVARSFPRLIQNRNFRFLPTDVPAWRWQSQAKKARRMSYADWVASSDNVPPRPSTARAEPAKGVEVPRVLEGLRYVRSWHFPPSGAYCLPQPRSALTHVLFLSPAYRAQVARLQFPEIKDAREGLRCVPSRLRVPRACRIRTLAELRREAPWAQSQRRAQISTQNVCHVMSVLLAWAEDRDLDLRLPTDKVDWLDFPFHPLRMGSAIQQILRWVVLRDLYGPVPGMRDWRVWAVLPDPHGAGVTLDMGPPDRSERRRVYVKKRKDTFTDRAKHHQRGRRLVTFRGLGSEEDNEAVLAPFHVRLSFAWHATFGDMLAKHRQHAGNTALLAQCVVALLRRLSRHNTTHGAFRPENVVLARQHDEDQLSPNKYNVYVLGFEQAGVYQHTIFRYDMLTWVQSMRGQAEFTPLFRRAFFQAWIGGKVSASTQACQRFYCEAENHALPEADLAQRFDIEVGVLSRPQIQHEPELSPVEFVELA